MTINLALITKTSLALLAFASNSILCRLALESGEIDPASFTLIRIASGAIALTIILLLSKQVSGSSSHAKNPTTPLLRFNYSDWLSGLSLFIYAAGFSFAYVSLPAGTGALILFASVQLTMLGAGIMRGMRLLRLQWIGFAFAIFGLVYLLSPGLTAPPLLGTTLMILAGVAWGIYSLKGAKSSQAIRASTENFIRAVPYCIGLSIVLLPQIEASIQGVLLAIVSGAVTSGLGYVIWYSALPELKTASAASLQLTVPVIAIIGGAIWLQELIGLRLVLASICILGGVALVVLMSKDPVSEN
ncbi:DMT family transporter [Ningiella sp. W23]|uniref:DMT family transporter n=1 Tax=Ningiella sp. W23 TaxID=3023715 RepID=UPI003756B626